MNLHISYCRKKIDENFLKTYKEEIALVGLTCLKCGKELKVGDYVDGFYPYEIEYNICKECEKQNGDKQ